MTIQLLNTKRQPIAPPDEAAGNVASVERVPLAVVPAGPARTTLLKLARAGSDCYGYASGSDQSGTWCVWLGDLADVRSDRNGRVPLADEWVPNFRALLAEMGLMLGQEARR